MKTMNTEKQIKELRELFPVTKHWTYLYNGSIHPCPVPVKQAMQTYLERWQNGGEAAFFDAYDAFEKLKEKFAKLIHTRPDNIVITESTSAAINLAAQIIRPKHGQNIVLTDLAFMSSAYLWLASQSATGEVRFVKSRDGKIYMNDLEAEIDENTALISICAITVGSGFRFNLSEVSGIARRHNVPLIVDGAQALGVVDIDVNKTPMDFLATTASKWLMGPTGVGFLYVSDHHLDVAPPSVGWLAAANVSDWDIKNCQLHKTAMRFQGGIPNLIGVVGALAGLEFIEQIGRDFIEQRIRQLTSYAIRELEKLDVDIWTPKADQERAGIVFFRVPGHKALHTKLKAASIYCGNFLDGIRIDPNFYNTFEEIDKFLSVVKSHIYGG